MRRANKAGVHPDVSAAKEKTAAEMYDRKVAEINAARRNGAVPSDQAVRMMQEVRTKNDAALKRMRDSLYREDFKPGW